jgi:monoamine oxidase
VRLGQLQLQAGSAGGLTLLTGGKAGVVVAKSTPEDLARDLLPGVERAFPGGAEWRRGPVWKFGWPTYAWTKGSYSAYKPGQWTSLRGNEAKPVGNLLFAGEHCSLNHQGYMNGGAETGRRAAQAILARLGRSAAA